MKYFEKYPNVKPNTEVEMGILRTDHFDSCAQCGHLTQFVEINYQAHFCSEECLEEFEKSRVFGEINKMKKIFITLFALISIFVLSGCYSFVLEKDFTKVGNIGAFDLVYDNNTKCMYLYYYSSYGGPMLTPYYGADGNIVIYTE